VIVSRAEPEHPEHLEHPEHPEHPDHYSYRHYADPETARLFDERRFGGPIGALIAETQARVLTEFLGDVQGQTLLDVGTGTGRAAIVLARAGAIVTGVDPSDEMLAVARPRAAQAGVAVSFQHGDAHALKFADRSFDAAISLRVLMHTPGWQTCLAELCRVSRGLVVIDYPSKRSVARLESIVRRAAHAAGIRTEPYRVLSPAQVERAFTENGFRVRAVHRQFVLPIALHKAFGSRALTERVEQGFERTGLLAWFGSPVTLVAERCARS
jgi:2-polyprenyl-3-methyl-5-hydroxy-6-metoxy-1,4-benzoquinol methylase